MYRPPDSVLCGICNLVKDSYDSLWFDELISYYATNACCFSSSDSAISVDSAVNTTVSKVNKDAADAERLLDALVRGNVSMDDSGVGGLNLSNVSEIVTGDGQRIVIVIAKDDEVQNVKEAIATASSPNAHLVPSPAVSPVHSNMIPSPAASPALSDTSSNMIMEDDDEEWSPYSPVATASTSSSKTTKAKKTTASGRVSKPRGPYNKRASSSSYNVISNTSA